MGARRTADGRRLTKSGRPYDTQSQALYRWERKLEAFSFGEDLDLGECRDYVAAIWDRHAPRTALRSPPRVRDGRGSRKARGNRHVIKLPRQMRTRGVIVHETCHALIGAAEWWRGNGDRGPFAPHGREFARLYLSLLGHWLDVSKSRARGRAIRDREKGTRRVHFATIAEVEALGLRNL